MTAHSCFLITNTPSLCGVRKRALADGALYNQTAEDHTGKCMILFYLRAVSTNGKMILTQREAFVK